MFKKALVIVVMVMVAVGLMIAVSTTSADSANAEKLLGSWNVEISTPNQGTFPALITFSADGSVIASESPLPFESSGHGSWVSSNDGEAAFTFVALFGGEEGKNTGKLTVVGTLQFDAGNNSWSGPFKINVVDASGQDLAADAGTFSMTHIAVEPLS
jgi:hypothetical protein